MYVFLTILQILAYTAVIVFVAAVLIERYRANAPKRVHQERKALLSHSTVDPTEDDGSPVEPDKANQMNLAFGGVRSIQAGQTVMGLPMVDPIKENKLADDRTVLAVGRVVAYPKQGAIVSDLIWVNGNYLTGVINNRPCVFRKLSLTDSELRRVEKERQEAVDSGDQLMKNLLKDGRDWTIRFAMGSNPNYFPGCGERENSYIQLTSISNLVGRADGHPSPVTPTLLDQQEHNYFDILAVNDDDDEIFFAFYAGMDGWNAYIGRKLTSEEVNSLKVV
jgi:hypothetical protein